MRNLRFVAGVLWVGMGVLSTGAVCGQDYPNRPIRIVTANVGGSSDFMARLIAQGISGPLGQPVIVDNRAGGIIVAEQVSKAPPNGHTILMTGSSFWIGTLLAKLSYDPVKDYSPITIVTKEPSILVVHPSLPVKSVKELIALAKAKPGELNYGSGVTGSTPHIAGELFNSMADVKIVRIPYKNATFAANDLLGGEGKTIHMGFWGLGLVTPHVKSDKMRALAVTSAEPFALAPGLPTVAASGLPGFESVSLNAVFAPAKTPTAIIIRLNQEIERVVSRPDVKEKIFTTGAEPVGSSPEEFAAKLQSEISRISKLIKDAGIKAD